jgi:hypothetical protein
VRLLFPDRFGKPAHRSSVCPGSALPSDFSGSEVSIPTAPILRKLLRCHIVRYNGIALFVGCIFASWSSCLSQLLAPSAASMYSASEIESEVVSCRRVYHSIVARLSVYLFHLSLTGPPRPWYRSRYASTVQRK